MFIYNNELEKNKPYEKYSSNLRFNSSLNPSFKPFPNPPPNKVSNNHNTVLNNLHSTPNNPYKPNFTPNNPYKPNFTPNNPYKPNFTPNSSYKPNYTPNNLYSASVEPWRLHGHQKTKSSEQQYKAKKRQSQQHQQQERVEKRKARKVRSSPLQSATLIKAMMGVSVLLAVIGTTTMVAVVFTQKDKDNNYNNTVTMTTGNPDYSKTSRIYPSTPIKNDPATSPQISSTQITSSSTTSHVVTPTCKFNQYYCKDSGCHDNVLLCDGITDCPHGDDETHPTCVSCKSDQFKCITNNICVSKMKTCDGVVNCGDGSDEEKCVKLAASGDLVMASRTGNAAMEVCYAGVTKEREEMVCKMNGFKGSVGSSKIPTTTNNNYIVIDSIINLSNTLVAKTRVVRTCADGLWKVSCSKWECGTRAKGRSYGQYIINGFKAVEGAWPWSGSLIIADNRLCGVVLIDKRFVLTAAHCVQKPTGYIYDSNLLEIKLGSVSLDYGDTFKVEKFVVHSGYNSKLHINDFAILKLNRDVIFSDNINAICLPSYDLNQPKYKVCVSVGYGMTSKNKISKDLLQTRMNIMNKCNYANKNTLCVGTIPGIDRNNLCNGDSGGPLSCMDEGGRWFVAGIHNYVVSLDHVNYTDYRFCQASVVGNVARYELWINDEKMKMT